MRALSPVWLTTLVTTALAASGLCLLARRRPGRQSRLAEGLLAVLLLAVSGLWLSASITAHRFSPATSLPFALCDLATLVAAAALLTRQRHLVELTYFWGLAGTLQSLLTPDLSVPFPRLEFFEYVLAHAGIVCAALVLVVGEQIRPARLAVPRVFSLTLGYTGLVALVDWATGGNYMYLRRPPGNWTLLDLLGPWPWYIASAAGVAVALFFLLDLPFLLRPATSPRPLRLPRSRPEWLRPTGSRPR